MSSLSRKVYQRNIAESRIGMQSAFSSLSGGRLSGNGDFGINLASLLDWAKSLTFWYKFHCRSILVCRIQKSKSFFNQTTRQKQASNQKYWFPPWNIQILQGNTGRVGITVAETQLESSMFFRINNSKYTVQKVLQQPNNSGFHCCYLKFWLRICKSWGVPENPA